MKISIRKITRHKCGATLVEYAVVVCLVCLMGLLAIKDISYSFKITSATVICSVTPSVTTKTKRGGVALDGGGSECIHDILNSFDGDTFPEPDPES